jgi:hypothetical protein
LAVLILIALGSTTAVDGSGILWFIGICSLVISTMSTILLMFNKEGMTATNIHFLDGIIPWGVIVRLKINK